jgi:nucleotide-binding universal stress UspA family protein
MSVAMGLSSRVATVSGGATLCWKRFLREQSMSESAVASVSTNDVRPVIVVGVDGSDASKDALRWAADYTALVAGQLRAMSAWEWPVTLGVALPLPEDYSPLDDANENLAQTVREVLGSSPAVAVTTEIVEGPPAAALVAASQTAALLVVGSRGHGGFTGLLLGSTSENCVRHAACPVVVVRHQKTGEPQ